jgi:hypothetical protein
MEITVSALSNLESSEVVFFAERTLAALASDFPSKRLITLLAKSARACRSLQIETVLFEIVHYIQLLVEKISVESLLFHVPERVE